jgi:hypothetical protein
MRINPRPCALLTRCDTIGRPTAIPVPATIASRKSFVRHDRARFCRAGFGSNYPTRGRSPALPDGYPQAMSSNWPPVHVYLSEVNCHLNQHRQQRHEHDDRHDDSSDVYQ